MTSFQDNLARALRAEGAALVGFADLGRLPADARDSLPFGIAIAANIHAQVISGIGSGPTPEYHAEYARANTLLARLAALAGDMLRESGFRAAFARPTVGSAELGGNLSTALPHKTVATRAGLGWVGKCALLITPQYGSAVRLISVLTDAPLSPGKPIDLSACGRCRACVEACPAKAPTGDDWTAGKPRDSFFDAMRCRAKARDLAAASGIDETICGICIAACPWTQRYLTTARTER